MKRIPHPSPALVIACIALAVALSGVSYAAIILPHNSVGLLQLKANSVNSAKVINHSLLKADFKAGQIPAGAAGPAGPAGPAGAAGAAGAAGTNLTAETPLASGQSESGFFSAGGGSSTSGYIGQGISFVQPLAQPIPSSNIIWNKSGTTSSHCSGYGHADAGYACLYDNEQNNVTSFITYSSGFSIPSAGFATYWVVTAANSYVSGEYTVTAP